MPSALRALANAIISSIRSSFHAAAPWYTRFSFALASSDGSATIGVTNAMICATIRVTSASRSTDFDG